MEKRIEQLLKKRNINEQTIHTKKDTWAYFKKLPESFDQNIARGLSRGKWLIGKATIDTRYISFSPASYKAIISLFDILLPQARCDLKMKADGFKADISSQRKYGLIKISTKNISTTIEKDVGKGEKSVKIKSFGWDISKKEIINFLKRYFQVFYFRKMIDAIDFLDVTIRSEKTSIYFTLYSNDATVYLSGIKPNKKVLEMFNKIFVCNLKSISGYCLWYLDIRKIIGGWYGRREGYVVNEVGSAKGRKERRFKFE